MPEESGPPQPKAEKIFAEYLRRRAEGDDITFDEYCKKHPEWDTALRLLMSQYAAHGEATRSSPPTVSEGSRPTDPPPVSAYRKEDLAAGKTVDALVHLSGKELLAFENFGLKRGDRVDTYELRKLLGVGGNGAVFLAHQKQPYECDVALKVLRGAGSSRETLARFRVECEALASMNHTGIAKVFTAGTTPGGLPYFVMEYVRGTLLTEYCDAKVLPLGERLRLFIEVCAAVQHAHQQGIIHRDLKPLNILVTLQDDEPVPKVIDFGIAKPVPV